jgi:hypothetical protein
LEKNDTECVKPYMEKTIGSVLKEYEMTGKLRIPDPKVDFDGDDFVKTMCKVAKTTLNINFENI